VSDVGTSGLIWLFLSYGYVLYYASNLISEGSDLLMLVPSMAGLVGGVVLPLLGAVPDGAIMLFSGLGDIESAQETLSVGVGALAGSTIMLLTIPWGLSILAGRVDIDPQGNPSYNGKPKLTSKSSIMDELTSTGVSISETVSHGAKIMMISTIPYFLIQVPAFFIHGPSEDLAKGEKYWALAGLVVCLVGFVSYLYLQLQISRAGEDKGKRVAVVRKLLQQGQVSLSGALTADVKILENKASHSGAYGSISNNIGSPDESVKAYLKDVLGEAFIKYDVNGNGTLDAKEVKTCELPADSSEYK
jgi:Ca2+/Na+ antiporter